MPVRAQNPITDLHSCSMKSAQRYATGYGMLTTATVRTRRGWRQRTAREGAAQRLQQRAEELKVVDGLLVRDEVRLARRGPGRQRCHPSHRAPQVRVVGLQQLLRGEDVRLTWSFRERGPAEKHGVASEALTCTRLSPYTKSTIASVGAEEPMVKTNSPLLIIRTARGRSRKGGRAQEGCGAGGKRTNAGVMPLLALAVDAGRANGARPQPRAVAVGGQNHLLSCVRGLSRTRKCNTARPPKACVPMALVRLPCRGVVGLR